MKFIIEKVSLIELPQMRKRPTFKFPKKRSETLFLALHKCPVEL
jgi:hypothetical protein